MMKSLHSPINRSSFAAIQTLLAIIVSANIACADESVSIAKIQQAAVAPKINADRLEQEIQQTAAKDRVEEHEAWTKVGAGYALVPQMNEAIYATSQAIILSATNAHARNNLGFFLMDSEKPEEQESAKTLFEDAIRIAPDEPAFHQNLGLLLLKMGQRDKALEHLKIAGKDRSHPNGAYAYAKAVYESGDSESAANALRGSLMVYAQHLPSLELYKQVTGENWTDPKLDEIEKRLIAYIDDTEALVRAYAKQVKHISADGGTKDPSDQIIKFGITSLDIARSSIEREQSSKMAADYANAIKAKHLQIAIYLTSITRIKTINGFYPYIALWEACPSQPNLEFSFIGGATFLLDESDFNARLTAYNEAKKIAEKRVEEYRDSVSSEDYDPAVALDIECQNISLPAYQYTRKTPPMLNQATQRLNSVLNQQVKRNAEAFSDYRSFMDLLDPYLAVLPGLPASLKQQEELVQRLCEGKDDAVGGLKHGSTKAIGSWKRFVDQHESTMDQVWKHHIAACQCEREYKDLNDPDSVLQQLFAVLHQDGKYGNKYAVATFGPANFKLYSSGKVAMNITPFTIQSPTGAVKAGPTAGVYGNMFSDNWGLKIGGVAGTSSSGIGVTNGAFIRVDSDNGFSMDLTATTGYEHAGFGFGTEFTTSSPIFVANE